MDLSKTTVSQRCHIAFFGCRNAGKSSLVNAFVSQNLSVVSDKEGTTTDPVKKTMELLPFGPVVVIDTPGFDDEGDLGALRVSKTNEILGKTDVAVLVVDASKGFREKDYELLELFKAQGLNFIVAFSKSDLIKTREKVDGIYLSAATGENIIEFRNLVGGFVKKFQAERENKFIIADKLATRSTVVLVIPIDEAAPKGRLILPQQLVLRELLDFHHQVICTQDTELEAVLEGLKVPPSLVITDSQVFEKVKTIVSEGILLTSFSILFARYKGNLERLVRGARQISKLKNGSKVLISEGCTHHRQCNDIGSVKFPNWLKNFTGAQLEFEFTSGGEFPQNLSEYALIIHCGGCMLNEAEMKTRVKRAVEQEISIVNYGIAIAYMNGILSRSLEIFPEVANILVD